MKEISSEDVAAKVKALYYTMRSLEVRKLRVGVQIIPDMLMKLSMFMCMPIKIYCCKTYYCTANSIIGKAGATGLAADVLTCCLQNKLGGGEGVEGLYGTLACGGMQKVLDCMAANCGLQSTSRLVDVGAGIGRCVQRS